MLNCVALVWLWKYPLKLLQWQTFYSVVLLKHSVRVRCVDYWLVCVWCSDVTRYSNHQQFPTLKLLSIMTSLLIYLIVFKPHPQDQEVGLRLPRTLRWGAAGSGPPLNLYIPEGSERSQPTHPSLCSPCPLQHQGANHCSDNDDLH